MKRKSRDSNAANGRRRPPRIYLNKFRVPIYIQLCAVICILTGLCVMVVAVSTVNFSAPSHPPDRFLWDMPVLICVVVYKRQTNTFGLARE
jgi:hypothetical protein